MQALLSPEGRSVLDQILVLRSKQFSIQSISLLRLGIHELMGICSRTAGSIQADHQSEHTPLPAIALGHSPIGSESDSLDQRHDRRRFGREKERNPLRLPGG